MLRSASPYHMHTHTFVVWSRIYNRDRPASASIRRDTVYIGASTDIDTAVAAAHQYHRLQGFGKRDQRVASTRVRELLRVCGCRRGHGCRYRCGRGYGCRFSCRCGCLRMHWFMRGFVNVDGGWLRPLRATGVCKSIPARMYALCSR